MRRSRPEGDFAASAGAQCPILQESFRFVDDMTLSRLSRIRDYEERFLHEALVGILNSKYRASRYLQAQDVSEMQSSMEQMLYKA